MIELLPDGTEVHIRPIRPDDRRLLEEGLQRLGSAVWPCANGDGIHGMRFSRGDILGECCQAPLQLGSLEAGDHTIYFGQVENLAARPGRPLVYHGSTYRRLASEDGGAIVNDQV